MGGGFEGAKYVCSPSTPAGRSPGRPLAHERRLLSPLAPSCGRSGILTHVQRLALALLAVSLAGCEAAPPAPTLPQVTLSEGDFTLSLISAKQVYPRGEQLDVSATFTYAGPDEYVVTGVIGFGHASARGNAAEFVYSEMARDFPMESGVPVVRPWWFDPPSPPPGHWIVVARAIPLFVQSPDGSGIPGPRLEATLVVEVR